MEDNKNDDGVLREKDVTKGNKKIGEPSSPKRVYLRIVHSTKFRLAQGDDQERVKPIQLVREEVKQTNEVVEGGVNSSPPLIEDGHPVPKLDEEGQLGVLLIPS